jgi:hypothetical protein
MTTRDVPPHPMAKLTDEQRRALRLLAGVPSGCTEALMLARGFETRDVRKLLRDGLAKIETHRALSGGQHVVVTLMQITAAGRKAIAA